MIEEFKLVIKVKKWGGGGDYGNYHRLNPSFSFVRHYLYEIILYRMIISFIAACTADVFSLKWRAATINLEKKKINLRPINHQIKQFIEHIMKLMTQTYLTFMF